MATFCSKVAQWWSTRLLTDRLWVRVPPLEPIFFTVTWWLRKFLWAPVFAGMAELADAQDLKSCDPYRSYRFDPGFRHHLQLGFCELNHKSQMAVIFYIRCRGVEQLVARRAHNPEVAGSNPVPATINPLISVEIRGFSLFLLTFSCG